MKTNLLIALCLITASLHAQITVEATLFASGFDSPVSIAHSGDSRLFVVERAGLIKILNTDGSVVSTPFLDIDSIVSNGNDERGLLGLAFDPAYTSNGYFYVYYIDNSNNSQIARYRVSAGNPNLADATSRQPVLSVTQPAQTNHKGGNLVFGPDGYLYCGLGDGGGSGDPSDNSQNMQTLLGKMIRIDVSTLPYSIPATNPYLGSAPLDEIWAAGLRNPWKWSFDKSTGDLWIADVGQGNWEEINFQPAGSQGGENYGWRCYEGNDPFNLSGCSGVSAYDFPVYAYPHSGPNSGCSATGGYVYRGAKYASLYGTYLFTDYCSGNIWGLDPSYNLTDYGSYGFGMSAFGEDIYGELYIANVSNGNIYIISTVECAPVALIVNADTSYLCISPVTLQALQGNGLTYQWLRNGFPIPGGTAPSYSPNVGSNYRVIVTDANGCSSVSDQKWVINNKPAAVITGDTDYCFGETALLNANQGSGLTYQWKHKNIDIPGANQPDYTASLPGSYRVLVTNSQGCTRLANPFVVTGPPPGMSILNGNNILCQGDSVEIYAKATGPAYTFQWLKNDVIIPGATNENYYASTQGFYKVMVSNLYGCSKTGSGKAVYVNSCVREEAIEAEWKHYKIYSAEGKLLQEGIVSENITDTENYFRNNFSSLRGFLIVTLYDEHYLKQRTLRMIL